ncbi:protein of unknown function [Streptomyces sp. KY75]|nr:protein of unknown function [Streptomyces sp. KY70]CAD5995382.1 protein of unknown function [Streptomyces sp. KY75]
MLVGSAGCGLCAVEFPVGDVLGPVVVGVGAHVVLAAAGSASVRLQEAAVVAVGVPQVDHVTGPDLLVTGSGGLGEKTPAAGAGSAVLVLGRRDVVLATAVLLVDGCVPVGVEVAAVTAVQVPQVDEVPADHGGTHGLAGGGEDLPGTRALSASARVRRGHCVLRPAVAAVAVGVQVAARLAVLAVLQVDLVPVLQLVRHAFPLVDVRHANGSGPGGQVIPPQRSEGAPFQAEQGHVDAAGSQFLGDGLAESAGATGHDGCATAEDPLAVSHGGSPGVCADGRLFGGSPDRRSPTRAWWFRLGRQSRHVRNEYPHMVDMTIVANPSLTTSPVRCGLSARSGGQEVVEATQSRADVPIAPDATHRRSAATGPGCAPDHTPILATRRSKRLRRPCPSPGRARAHGHGRRVRAQRLSALKGTEAGEAPGPA